MIAKSRTIGITLLLMAWPSILLGQPVQERAALKSYLQTHRLYGLYANLLEDELLNAADKSSQQTTATALADLYAWQLNSRPDQFQYFSDRLDELSRNYPDAIPVTTQINIAYGRYRRAKQIFEDWIWARDDVDLREQVNSRFGNVVQRATDAVARLDLQLADNQLASPARRDLETAQAQFRYLAGWARYYRSISIEDARRRRSLLEAAEKDFLQLLDVANPDVLMDLSPQWWSLNSEWTCRLLLGLGMASQALDRGRQAEFCFNLLSESRVPTSIRTSQRVWQFHSFVFPGQTEHADVMVRKWESDSLAEGDVPFWSSVAIAGISWPQPTRETTNMIRAGLKGLARANEFRIVDEIHDRFANVTVSGNDFFARWMDGYAALKHAQFESTSAENPETRQSLARARRELQQALESNVSVAPVYRARCRYHFGFALYLARQFDEAAEQFRETSTVLKRLDPPLAEHAGWMRCQALQRLAATDIAWSRSLSFALGEFQRQFPNSINTQQAAFMQVMNQLDDEPADQALKTLRSIEQDEANFQRALFEICRLCHRMWSEATDDNIKQQMAGETIAAAKQYIDQLTPDPSDGNSSARFVRICLLAADVWLHRDSVDQANTWLQRCESWLPVVQSARDIGSDYYFLQMNVAARQSDDQQEAVASKWLLKNTTNAMHLRSALISQARLLDRQLIQSLESTGTRDPRQLDQVIDAYQRLVDEYSPDDARLDSDNVARTALFRLAELQMESARHTQARNSYSRLHRAMPNQLPFLSGLAAAEMQIGNMPIAAKHWRTIASGFSPGTETWLNAKYNLIVCLLDDQPENARAVWQQVQLLVPELPDAWAARFDELQSQMANRP